MGAILMKMADFLKGNAFCILDRFGSRGNFQFENRSLVDFQIRNQRNREFRAAEIRFQLHKEFCAAEIRFSLHKDFRAGRM